MGRDGEGSARSIGEVDRADVVRERGEATIEFIALTVAVVVPIIYLVMALSSLQAAVFAAEAGSREAARVLAADSVRTDLAREQIDLAFADHGLATPEDVTSECVPVGCSGPGAHIRVQVATSVALPLIPAWAGQVGRVPISATSEALVEGLALDG